jgi:tartrate dehydrogenase/decarboxylase/D-malate dehydrogenase
LRVFDSILFGAVGTPQVPDHLTVWGLILPIRQGFDQYVNLRPIKWLDGVPSPLCHGRQHDVDMLIVRENVEGEYTEIGGRFSDESGGEYATQTAIFTRAGIRRIAEYAFAQAQDRRGSVTSITKSNALRHTMVFWDEVVEEVAGEFEEVQFEKMHVDAAAYEIVMDPGRFDVILAGNLFGDILTDLGAALQGSLGLAASANLDPSRRFPSLFEPVHGSAPSLVGKNVANPGGAIWAASMMLDDLGLEIAGRRSMKGLTDALSRELGTPDIGGSLSTTEFTDEILRFIESDESERES